MQISNIKIDGFGIFSSRNIDGLTTGINVLYGGNEFGKTTLLEFIRRILFGFPRSSVNINPYPALYGGLYGGRLTCILADGRNVIISRTQGKHGGDVTINIDSNQLFGQDELNSLLGHITKLFYENVYAISLDDLQAVRSLQEDEIKNRIYGAGLGLGGLSLSEILETFKKRGESVYKQHGSAQIMPRLLADIRNKERTIFEIQKELAKYDTLVMTRDQLLSEVSDLQKQRDKLQEVKLSLENRQRLFPEYLKLASYQNELSKMEVVPQFSDDAPERMRKLQAEVNTYREKIDENAEELRNLKLRRDNLIYDKQIIEQETKVISLQKLSGEYKSALNDIDEVKEKSTTLEEKLDRQIEQISKEWNELKVRQFNLTHLQKDKASDYKRRFDEINRVINETRGKLDYHKEQKAAELTRGLAGPNFYKYMIYAIVGVASGGLIFGILSSFWLMVIISAVSVALGFSVIRKVVRPNRISMTDPLAVTLTEKLNEIEKESRKLDSEWCEFLRGIGFDENLSSEAIIGVFDSIHKIQSELSTLDEYRTRIERMQNVIDKVRNLHNEITDIVPNFKTSEDIPADIEMLTHYLNAAKEPRSEKKNVNEQIGTITSRINSLETRKTISEKNLHDYIASFDTKDEEDFWLKYNLFIKREELTNNINESNRIIQSTVGRGEQYDDFITLMHSANPEEIEIEITKVNEQLESINNLISQNNQDIGELRSHIEQLSSSEDLSIEQNELAMLKQRLCDYSRDWVESQLALYILEKAISKYENTRQPQVMKAAEQFFSKVTGNNYSSIIKPIDSEDLQIHAKHGVCKRLMEMSRGTREQLYFAMRLGLIEEYEKRSEPMPIIMDDILVNFDDERGPLAIEALGVFSKNRQVIVLSCHKNAVGIYRKLGANEICLA